MSLINNILGEKPQVVYLHQNKPLQSAITGSHTMLRESTTFPTRCRELVLAWLEYVGINDVSKEGVGGIVAGALKE